MTTDTLDDFGLTPPAPKVVLTFELPSAPDPRRDKPRPPRRFRATFTPRTNGLHVEQCIPDALGVDAWHLADVGPIAIAAARAALAGILAPLEEEQNAYAEERNRRRRARWDAEAQERAAKADAGADVAP